MKKYTTYGFELCGGGSQIWIDYPRGMNREKAIYLAGKAVGAAENEAHLLSKKLDETVRIKLMGKRGKRKAKVTFAGRFVCVKVKK